MENAKHNLDKMESLQIIHLFMLAYRKATFEQLMEMMTKYNNQ